MAALLATTALTVSVLALPNLAWAACAPPAVGAGDPPPTSVVTCSGNTVNQNNPDGYGTGGNDQTELIIAIEAGATVQGSNNGFNLGADNLFANSGAITGTTAAGINTTGAVTVINVDPAATITGNTFGVVSTTTANVDNSGTVTSTAGTAISAQTANVINTGIIQGQGGTGDGIAAVSVAVDNGGTIAGTRYGINASDVTLTNSNNAVTGGTAGINATGVATVTNSATISGNQAIIATGGGSVITNSGTLTGTGGNAIDFGASNNNTLSLTATSIINGTVTGTGANNLFQLGGSANGNFNVSNIGAGQQYQGFDLFEKNGSATWTLSGTGAADQNWNITGGTLVGNTTSIQGAAITNNAALVFDQAFNGTYAGTIAGTGVLRMIGAGTLALTGNNSFSGGVTINGGTISVGHDNALGTGTFTVLGSTLDIQNGITISNATDLQANLDINVDPAAQGTHAGDIGETGGSLGINKIGGGTLVLSGNNTYTGATNVDAGTLLAASSTALALQSAFTVNTGATLQILDGGVFAGIGSLAGAGSVVIGGGGSLLAVGFNGNSSTFSGDITGNGSFEYLGAGTLNLTGSANAIGGNLTVCACATGVLDLSGGSFNVGGFTSVFGGTLAVTDGGTLTSTGQTQIGGNDPGFLRILSGGVVNSQGGAAVDAVNGTPAVLVSGPGSTWNVDIGLAIGNAGFGGVGNVTVADGGVINSTGFTTIGPGSALNLGAGGLAGTINTPQIVNDGQVVANFTDTLTLGIPIDGSGSLSKLGPGTLVVTGNNSFTGGVTINGGTIRVEHDNALGAGTFTVLGSTLDIQEGVTVSNATDLQANLRSMSM
jgi:autotransporter-associated beta strand protein